ncbi:MAG: carbon-nitrogen hydrolase family protein [Chloroflexi bacterium]|nr:carbon-nitrogen hydrolase family protein [Chloroflexota bacterium]MBI3740534.1 carbon-nitrogen hydrolase family protein [Chloroflexota bacterium]
MREVYVAIVQFHPRLAEPIANIERMLQIIDNIAGAQRVNLIVFPELATTGYECGVKFTELAELIPGPTIEQLGARAERYQTHIAFGMVVKHKVESIVYDAAVLIAPDAQVLGQYFKVHLKPEERPLFRGGLRFPVFETSFGRVGLLLGWDLEFPEAARTLALDGAELIAVCANWEAQSIEEWRALLLARGIENQFFVAGANRIGEEYTYAFGGESMIAGPRGETLATVGRDENDRPKEAYSIAKIDLDLVKKYREELQTMQSRQPIAYRTVVRNY